METNSSFISPIYQCAMAPWRHEHHHFIICTKVYQNWSNKDWHLSCLFIKALIWYQEINWPKSIRFCTSKNGFCIRQYLKGNNKKHWINEQESRVKVKQISTVQAKQLPWLQKSMPGTRPSTQTVSPVTVQLLHVSFVVRLLDFLTWLPALNFPILIPFWTLIHRNTKFWPFIIGYKNRREIGNQWEKKEDRLTFFISFRNATLMIILHFWKYIRSRHWNVQSTGPKYWIRPRKKASLLSTSNDLVAAIKIH